MRYFAMVLMGMVLAVAAAGCYQNSAPLVTVGDMGYGGRSKPVPSNIPPGPEHQVCRDEMSKALAQIDRLQKDLDKSKADRDKLERDNKSLKQERDMYKKMAER